MRNALILAAAAFTALGFVWFATTQPADAATEQVAVGSNWFCTSSFQNGVCTTTITVGDTVTWIVTEGTHTVTECNADYTVCSGGFGSGSLGFNDTFSETLTFATTGSYPYNCSFHPSSMRGVISVAPVSVGGIADFPDIDESLAEVAGSSGGLSFPLAPLVIGLVIALAAVAGVSWHRYRRRAG